MQRGFRQVRNRQTPPPCCEHASCARGRQAARELAGHRGARGGGGGDRGSLTLIQTRWASKTQGRRSWIPLDPVCVATCTHVVRGTRKEGRVCGSGLPPRGVSCTWANSFVPSPGSPSHAWEGPRGSRGGGGRGRHGALLSGGACTPWQCREPGATDGKEGSRGLWEHGGASQHPSGPASAAAAYRDFRRVASALGGSVSPAVKWDRDTDLSPRIAERTHPLRPGTPQALEALGGSEQVEWGHIPQVPPPTSRGRLEKSPLFPKAAVHTYEMGVTGILPSQNREN